MRTVVDLDMMDDYMNVLEKVKKAEEAQPNAVTAMRRVIGQGGPAGTVLVGHTSRQSWLRLPDPERSCAGSCPSAPAPRLRARLARTHPRHRRCRRRVYRVAAGLTTTHHQYASSRSRSISFATSHRAGRSGPGGDLRRRRSVLPTKGGLLRWPRGPSVRCCAGHRGGWRR